MVLLDVCIINVVCAQSMVNMVFVKNIEKNAEVDESMAM